MCRQQEYTNLYKSIYITPIVPDGYKSSWAQYTLLSENRVEAMTKFNENEIPTIIYYATCLHEQTAFKSNIQILNKLPNAAKYSKQVFSLPMHGYLDLTENK